MAEEATQAKEEKPWTQEDGQTLQDAIDKIFVPTGGDKGELGSLEFSLTIADPSLKDCPLIGSSTGFCTLCGYEMNEIVGRNCRFLIDPVAKHLINAEARTQARDFCNATRDGQVYKINDVMEEAWMPEGRPSDYGVFCAQTNMRKDGTLFKNMFYMRSVNLNDHTYILGLQSEIRDALDEDGAEKDGYKTDVYHKACALLEENMAEVERVLASKFWYSGPMRRQDDKDNEDGFCQPGPAQVWSGQQKAQGQAPIPKTESKSMLGRIWTCCSVDSHTVDMNSQVPQQAWQKPAGA
jgi:hypothetical protein